jgi:AcrR family transcriptional regulator
MRTVKKHQERRAEILDAAERLFYSIGYENCSVNEILREVGIAKGTFYHYFKSKEEAMDAVIQRNVSVMVSRVEASIKGKKINSQEKLMRAFLAMRMEEMVGKGMLDDLHKAENALLHQKSLSQTIEAIAPLLEGIIEEGIEERAWNCRYPLQYMKIFLAAALTLTDEGIFQTEERAQQLLMVALISTLENMLEVPEGQFLEPFLREWGIGEDP